jgi:hypothetical protein
MYRCYINHYLNSHEIFWQVSETGLGRQELGVDQLFLELLIPVKTLELGPELTTSFADRTQRSDQDS